MYSVYTCKFFYKFQFIDRLLMYALILGTWTYQSAFDNIGVSFLLRVNVMYCSCIGILHITAGSIQLLHDGWITPRTTNCLWIHCLVVDGHYVAGRIPPG